MFLKQSSVHHFVNDEVLTQADMLLASAIFDMK